MTTSIFIKTCKKDLEWFSYCIRSVRKYARDFDEVVVVCDESCRGFIEPLISASEKLFYVPDWPNGWIQQQAVKLEADLYTTADNIVFVDSDAIFTYIVTADNFLCDGKPVLYRMLYTDLADSSQSQWQAVTSQFTPIGWVVLWDYMLTSPIVFLRSTFSRLRLKFSQLKFRLQELPAQDGVTAEQAAALPILAFSEYNFLGTFIEHDHPDAYVIIDISRRSLGIATSTINDMCNANPQKNAPAGKDELRSVDRVRALTCKQYWSWGGITPEIRTELETFLR